jgi:hypothetical protein
MQNVFRSLFAVSLAFGLGAVAPGVQAQASFCTTGAAPGTSTPGTIGGYGLFAESSQYFASLVPGGSPACGWATPARFRLDLPQSPGLGGARLNLRSSVVLSSLSGDARRFTTTTISPVICTSFLDIAALPPGVSRGQIFALDLTNGGGTRMGGLCTENQPGGNPERCLWGLTGSSLQFGVGTNATGIGVGLVTNRGDLPYLQCYDATIPNAPLGSGPVSGGILYGDDFELPAPNVRVEFLADSDSDQRIEELLHAIGGSASYRVRITNLSGLPLTGVHLREFVPGAGGSITPVVLTDSCDELTGAAPIACPSPRLDRQVDLAAGQARVFRLQRRITGATAVSPSVGGLLSVAAFVNPDQGADSDPADNVRSLRLGTTSSFIVTPVVVGNGSAPACSFINPCTPRTVAPGGETFFTLTPPVGYVIQGVTGCGGTLPPGSTTYLIKNVQANCTVTATFALVTYTVTATPTTNGIITITNPTVPQGQPATFTVTPNTGYSANPPTGTSACGPLVNTGGVNWSTGPITSNGCEISATFTLNQYQVTVTTSGGNGTISPVGGNPGTSPVVQTVGHGSTASVAVTPAVGHSAVFGAASVGNCTFNPPATSNVWTSSAITGTCTVNVTFARNSYTVTAQLSASSPTGSAKINPATQQVLHGNNSQSISVNPNPGFVIDGAPTGCPNVQSGAVGNTVIYIINTVTAPCDLSIDVREAPN